MRCKHKTHSLQCQGANFMRYIIEDQMKKSRERLQGKMTHLLKEQSPRNQEISRSHY